MATTSPPHQINSMPHYRPQCSKCGSLMALSRIEPAGEPDHDLRTFECWNCDYTETIGMRFK